MSRTREQNRIYMRAWRDRQRQRPETSDQSLVDLERENTILRRRVEYLEKVIEVLQGRY